jgi:isopenicillin-N N-acyltransferase-like protein
MMSILPNERRKGELMAEFFPMIELKGSAYELGLQHGKALAGEIRANLTLYFDMVKGLTGTEPDLCLTHAGKFQKAINVNAPGLLEEMQGIAKGAGVSLDEILFLNARTELMSMRPSGEAERGECTAIGLTGKRTINGQAIIAQNWDWHERVCATSAVFLLEPADAPRAVFLAEAGQVGKIGFNQYGVGVTLNILMTGEIGYGLPVHVLLRMVLGTRNAGEAVSLIKDSPRGGTSHFLIGDNSGYLKGLELTQDKVAELGPKSGAVIHTNHYCDAALAEKDVGRLLMTDTTARFDRAANLVAGREQWDVQSLSELFTDHDGHPASICRHVNKSDPEFLHMMTVASFIMDLAAKKMLVTHGQPCKAAYQEVTLD